MPLIIISGYPSSGKTRRAIELKEYFLAMNKITHIVSEKESIFKTGFQKNDVYADSNKEKLIRADLKSETIRLLNSNNVVIIDAANYIKGYRYELYCASKAARTTQCTLFCGISKTQAWQFNNNQIDSSIESTYTKEIFDELWMRYEEPIGTNRWDSPLFTTLPDDEIAFDEIYNAIFSTIPPPPNQATQNVNITYFSIYLVMLLCLLLFF